MWHCDDRFSSLLFPGFLGTYEGITDASSVCHTGQDCHTRANFSSWNGSSWPQCKWRQQIFVELCQVIFIYINLLWFSIECHKLKPIKVIILHQSQQMKSISQNPKQIHVTGVKGGRTCSQVLIGVWSVSLVALGWKSGTAFFNQSQSIVKWTKPNENYFQHTTETLFTFRVISTLFGMGCPLLQTERDPNSNMKLYLGNNGHLHNIDT